MGLFQLGDFQLSSGGSSRFRIECDALTADDWAALAAMAVEVLPPFCRVFGVPRGGTPFAKALSAYATGDFALPDLIAEDVVTTGGSMERFVADAGRWLKVGPQIGVCVFARGRCPDWVTPLFQMPGRN